MKRFDLVIGEGVHLHTVNMEESVYGDYVLWEDVENLQVELEEWKRRANYVEGEVGLTRTESRQTRT